MLCGKELILATKPFAREIRSKSWFHTITTLLLWMLLLAGTVILPFSWLRIASSIIAGLVIVRMFIIYHDHQHHSKLFSASIGSYPIVTKKKFLEMRSKERFSYLATRHPLTIAFGYLS